jgi:hypothetical protein
MSWNSLFAKLQELSQKSINSRFSSELVEKRREFVSKLEQNIFSVENREKQCPGRLYNHNLNAKIPVEIAFGLIEASYGNKFPEVIDDNTFSTYKDGITDKFRSRTLKQEEYELIVNGTPERILLYVFYKAQEGKTSEAHLQSLFYKAQEVRQ